MSELSEGERAYGKGSTPDEPDHRRQKKRRRNRKHRRPPSSSKNADDQERGNADLGVAADTPRTNTDPGEHRPPPDKRRRRTRRPGAAPRKDSRVDTEAAPPPSAKPSSEQKHRAPGKSRWHHGSEKRKQGPHPTAPPAYAALDLGTNNCRLLIAVPRTKGRFRVIDGFSRIVRLGEGLAHTGGLGDLAMDRAIDALKVCAGKLNSRKIRKQRLIATEACRRALNGEDFLSRVKQETGLELEVVDRETEARLAVEGCGTLMDRNSDAAVMFDIGGGSTELILVDGRRGRLRDRIEAWTSLPMGVVTLAEKFGGKHVTPELFDTMKAFVTSEIEQFEGGKLFHGRDNIHLLGTSGTVTTLAGIHLKLPRYERRKVDGLWLSSSDIDVVTQELLAMDYDQRRSNPCIGEERADLVLAGCAILEAIREHWPAERLRVADRGLREGLLTEMMYADRVWKRRTANQKRSGMRHRR